MDDRAQLGSVAAPRSPGPLGARAACRRRTHRAGRAAMPESAARGTSLRTPAPDREHETDGRWQRRHEYQTDPGVHQPEHLIVVKNDHGPATERTEMLPEGVHVPNVAKRTQNPSNSWLDSPAVQRDLPGLRRRAPGLRMSRAKPTCPRRRPRADGRRRPRRQVPSVERAQRSGRRTGERAPPERDRHDPTVNLRRLNGKQPLPRCAGDPILTIVVSQPERSTRPTSTDASMPIVRVATGLSTWFGEVVRCH